MTRLDQFFKPKTRSDDGAVAAAAAAPPLPKIVCLNLELPDADVRYFTGLWTKKECDENIRDLEALEDWERRQIVVCGRECMQNRLTCFYARDPTLNYRYSGIENSNCKGFPSVVERICKKVSEKLGIEFNYCLLNKYSDGRQTIGWHADDERDLAPGSVIASCSFGAERFFDLRRRDDHSKKTRLNLANGSMVVMGKGTQEHYHHQVPQQAKITKPRYNLTFRVVV